mmetsp:Transcript_15637/g.38379  ORF Transcript_15637/g.38379 Transcript_15637/m.38379 type:complete len:307 (-) Transcript_15637:609-1529(-)
MRGRHGRLSCVLSGRRCRRRRRRFQFCCRRRRPLASHCSSGEQEAAVYPRARLNAVLPHIVYRRGALRGVLHQGPLHPAPPVAGERGGGRLLRALRICRGIHLHRARAIQGLAPHLPRAAVHHEPDHGLLPSVPPRAVALCARVHLRRCPVQWTHRHPLARCDHLFAVSGLVPRTRRAVECAYLVSLGTHLCHGVPPLLLAGDRELAQEGPQDGHARAHCCQPRCQDRVLLRYQRMVLHGGHDVAQVTPELAPVERTALLSLHGADRDPHRVCGSADGDGAGVCGRRHRGHRRRRGGAALPRWKRH